MKMTVRAGTGEQHLLMLCGLCAYRFSNVMPHQAPEMRAGAGGQLTPEIFSEHHFPTTRYGAFSGYSAATQEALKNAEEVTRDLGLPLVGTFQLLMGVMRLEHPVKQVLERNGVTLAEMNQVAEKIVGKQPPQANGNIPAEKQPAGRQIQLDRNTLSVLEMAQNKAVGLSNMFVEPQHLVLGMLELELVSATRWMHSKDIDLKAMERDLLDSLTAERQDTFTEVVEATPEEQLFGVSAAAPSQPPGPKQSTLEKYAKDLTKMAADGKLMPVVGREVELDRVERILSRLQKNNPILLGEPGVGKTAVVEALAQHIVSGEIPARLRECRVFEVDLASMIAGTQMRGEFEQRMKDLLVEVAKLGPRAILFIDESHTLVGAGASEGSMDAGNILKPALARGELHLIGATTKTEYRKYIEKDPALSRRFQPVLVGEPTIAQAIEMLEGIREKFEKHHGVTVSHESLSAAVTLSNQYLTDRFLPDKAIDLLDEACSMVAMEIEEKGQQRAVIADDVACVISQWTGIPLAKMIEPEKKRLLEMEKVLHERLINQEEAVSLVADVVKRSRAGLKDPHKPNGTFIFAGPTGVGKTELARSLADFLFENDQALIRIDMSEFVERESVNRLIGAPPGYVGYEEGGQLTEKVRFQPYSVVLFDEMEKAHPQVLNLLLQVADAGCLTDGQGRSVNFRNTIIILTTNVGADLFYRGSADLGFDDLKAQVTEMLVAATSPELINRMDAVVVFTPLTPEQVQQIIVLQLSYLARRLGDQQITLDVSPEAVALLAKQGYNPQMGARPAKRTIQNEIESPLSDMILGDSLKPGGTAKVTVRDGHLDISTA